MSNVGNNGKVCVVILEAIGVGEEGERNAVRDANMEFLNSLKTEEKSLYYELEANGEKVGLPVGKPGNNGVGVLVIGAGKRQYRNIVRISREITDGTFQTNEVLLKVLKDTTESNSRLHLLGCITDSQEEADMSHLYTLIECAKNAGVKEVYIHCLLDGEDSPSGKGLELVNELEDWIKSNGIGRIGSIAGKTGILDTEASLDNLEKYYKTIALGSTIEEESASAYIQNHYNELEEDGNMSSALVCSNAQFQDDDHVLLFNVRSGTSAVLMHTLLLCDPGVEPTEDSKKITDQLKFMETIAKPSIHVSSLVQYDDVIASPVLFKPLPIEKTYVRSLSEAGKKQLRVSEESRYTHIKFLLNGAGDMDVKNDDTVMIHDRAGLKDMKSLIVSMEATANMINTAMKSGYYDVLTTMLSAAGIAVNTKSLELTIDMCKEVDRVLKDICETAEKNGYSVIIVGTHSEATDVPEDDNSVSPINNVPCVIRPAPGVTFERQILEWYSLENVAATCLKIVGVEKEPHMEVALI